MRLESRSGSCRGIVFAASGRESVGDRLSLRSPSRVGVLSLSSIAVELFILLVFSESAALLAGSNELSDGLDGRLEEGYCRGLNLGPGPMLRLARSTSPVDKSASAKRLLRLDMAGDDAAER